jgi:hypothetical protein
MLSTSRGALNGYNSVMCAGIPAAAEGNFLTNRAVQFANVLDGIYFAINVAAFGLYFWHGPSLGRFRAAKDHELTVQAALSQIAVGMAPPLSIQFASAIDKICHFG